MLRYIDALIPGCIGLLVVCAPGLFTKAQGSAGEAARAKLRGVGLLMLVVAAVYAWLEVASG